MSIFSLRVVKEDVWYSFLLDKFEELLLARVLPIFVRVLSGYKRILIYRKSYLFKHEINW